MANARDVAPPPESAEELQRALQRQKERFDAAVAIGRAIGSTLDLDQILQLVIEQASRLVQAERSTLFLIDQDRREIWSKVVQGVGLREIRLPLGSGISGWVCVNGEAVVSNDPASDPRFNRLVDKSTGYKTQSMVVVPLRDVTGAVVGAIQALNRVGGSFTDDDRLLLEGVAAQAGVAIENARLYRDALKSKEALAESVAELDLLFDIERKISQAGTLEQLLAAILSKAIATLNVEAGSILLVEEETGHLYFETAQGQGGEAVKTFRLAPGEGIAGEVARTGEPILTNHAGSHPSHQAKIAKKVGLAVRSVLCVPLKSDDVVLGALELLNKRDAEFEQHDLRAATLIGGQIARAIGVHRARSEGERKARLAAIGHMVSSMLHDLRTPMTVISGYAELMVDDDDSRSRRGSAEVIIKQLEHINAMAKETLAFARGERDILLRKVYVGSFVEEVGGFLEKDLEGHEIELKVAANYSGAARMDEGKMKRALYNIARNAAQAMPEGGKFSLTVDREGDRLLFRCADTGPGIPEEIAGRLFQSFVTSGKKDGTGLGLAVVKKVVEEHGGEVSFKSRPGKGTTFTLSIPVRV